MSEPPVFYVAPMAIVPAGGNRGLAFLPREGAIIEIDPTSAHLLSCCRSARTLGEHANAVRRDGGAEDVDIVSNLDRLVARGLLLRAGTGSAIGAGGLRAPTTGDVTALGIITADRPNILNRCLDAVMRRSGKYGTGRQIVIIDGSRSAAAQADNRLRVARLDCTRFEGVRYVGQPEAAALRHRLAAMGLDPDVLTFGLTPGGIGANRNLLTLVSAGRDVVSCDDDVVWEPWAISERAPCLVLGGHGELRQTQYFHSRESALAAITPVDTDLLSDHGALLGCALSTLLSIAAEDTDTSRACEHMMAATQDGAARVRVTFAGLAGDAGTYCPSGVLFVDGSIKRTLMTDRASHYAAVSSREIVQIAAKPIVTHHAACMAGCMGLSNRTLLPPFPPSCRNEDGVFGSTLALIQPGALFAHVPVGIIHDSCRPSTRADELVRSATCTRLADLIHFAIRPAAKALLASSPAERLRRLGGWILNIGRMDVGDFHSYITQLTLDARSRELSHLEASLAQEPSCHEDWRAHAAVYRRTVLASLQTPDFFVPTEFKDTSPVQVQLRRVQAFLRDYGALLEAWPDIWEAAQDLRLMDGDF